MDGPNLIGCWMVAGLKAQPIGSHLVYFKKIQQMSLKTYLCLFRKFGDVTHYYILENNLDEEIVVQYF